MQTPGEISWIIERSLIHFSDLFCCPCFLCLHVVVVYNRVVCVCYVNSSGLPRLSPEENGDTDPTGQTRLAFLYNNN